MKNSELTNRIGIWMDHSSAKIIHLNGKIEKIKCNIEHRIAGESANVTRLGNYRSTNNESHRHNREINSHHKFFNKIYNAIKPYNEIIVFGPSTASSEFHNYLVKTNKKHRGRISVEKRDYMTENQLFEFVSNYFLKDQD
jgi:stalled ribosome rescue protein Dom34